MVCGPVLVADTIRHHPTTDPYALVSWLKRAEWCCMRGSAAGPCPESTDSSPTSCPTYDAAWMPLEMDGADAGTDHRERTVDSNRCTTINGVFARPRVSYLALFGMDELEHGRPVIHPEQIAVHILTQFLPHLLTTSAFAGAEAMPLHYCMLACVLIDSSGARFVGHIR